MVEQRLLVACQRTRRPWTCACKTSPGRLILDLSKLSLNSINLWPTTLTIHWLSTSMKFLDNPAWFLSSDDHHKLSLSKFSVSILRDAALSAKMEPMPQFKTKAQLINGLLVAFLNTRNLVMSKSTSDILPLFSRPPIYTSRSDLLSKYFSSIFGDIIASAFHIPQAFQRLNLSPPINDFSLIYLFLLRMNLLSSNPQSSWLKKLFKIYLTTYMHHAALLTHQHLLLV